MKNNINYLDWLQAMYGEHYFKKLGFVLWDFMKGQNKTQFSGW